MNGMELRQIEILLVEDNPGDVRLIQEAMKEFKVRNRLHVVSDGEAAIAFMRQRSPYENAPRPDLVLLDLNLPKRNGQSVLQEIKNDPGLCHIPVVILTSSRTEEDILRSYQLHANCFITKPVDIEQFIKVVKSIENFWLTIVKLPP